jgi:hypothetical protein
MMLIAFAGQQSHRGGTVKGSSAAYVEKDF